MVAMKTDRFVVEADTELRLTERETSPPNGAPSKSEAVARTDELAERLLELQQLLYADGGHKVLVVLQGMDSSGKDGTIKHVFKMVNPLGVRVVNFKRPNDVELAHDYLWRVHRGTPRDGEIAIFNRSHYEDVLVVRVHDLVPSEVWRRRYDQIRHFEQMLVDEGTVIRKFFLHISNAEQKARLQERLDNPAKHWKFEHGDIEERAYWDDYTAAYEDALFETSTDAAPWYVVPSDQKWFRNLVISTVLVDLLESLKLDYPPGPPDLDEIKLA
jgi:PPK2 family polyphosphate:nucleotide phosphotransferase